MNRFMSRLTFFQLLFILLVILPLPVPAQKQIWSVLGDEYWDDRFGPPGVTGSVKALIVTGSDIYVGGGFIRPGNERAEGIAKWNRDSRTWTALGNGFGGVVDALALSGNELYVAGRTSTIYLGTASGKIAKWNISTKTWTTIGSEIRGSVQAIAVIDNLVYVAGTFDKIGNLSVNNIAKWDGRSWSALNAGIHGSVHALAVHSKNLYVAGNFDQAGVVKVQNLAQWNGKNWAALTTGVDGVVETLAMNADHLYVGGFFTTLGEVVAHNIAKWDGSKWWQLGEGLGGENSGVDAIVSGKKGEVYVGWSFSEKNGPLIANISKWEDGRGWTPLDKEFAPGFRAAHFYSLALNDSELYVGGSFGSVGKIFATHIARWNFSTNSWSAILNGKNNGVGGQVRAIATRGKEVYVGGNFNSVGTMSVNGIAKWDGNKWFALGEGIKGIGNSRVNAIAANHRGDIYVGGQLLFSGNVDMGNIAKWDGSQWSALANGVNDVVNSLVANGNDIYVTGDFTMAGGIAANKIAKWDDQKWSSLGEGLHNFAKVYSIAIMDDEVYVAGQLSEMGNPSMGVSNFAKWDGQRWSEFAVPVKGRVNAITADQGTLYIAGYDLQYGGVSIAFCSKWDGQNWSALGSPQMLGPNAIVVKGKEIYLAGVLNRDWAGVLKWNGEQWVNLGVGVHGFRDEGISNDFVYTVGVSDDKVYIGGEFDWAVDGRGEKLSSNFAVWHGATTFGNVAPVWSNLPNVSFSENHFTNLALNDFVSDANNTFGQLTFSAAVIAFSSKIASAKAAIGNANVQPPLQALAGFNDLKITIDVASHIATFKFAGDSTGIFTVVFTVTDPGGLSASDTIQVTVTPVNDPSTIAALPELRFDEDKVLLYPIRNWYPFVIDKDHADSALAFAVVSDRKVSASKNGNNFLFSAPPNWFGKDTLQLIVTDPGKLTDTTSLMVTVNPVNDAPKISGLPDSLIFKKGGSIQLKFWDYVEDVETPNRQLTYSFLTSSPSLLRSFDHTTGVLVLTAPQFHGQAQLFINVSDSKAGVQDTIAVRVELPTNVTSREPALPTAFQLWPNSPNPFNPGTTIRFDMPHVSRVKLTVYSLRGELVQTLVDGEMAAGSHQAHFDGRNLASGVYFYRMETDSYGMTRKMILQK